jgi:hypothetical protein
MRALHDHKLQRIFEVKGHIYIYIYIYIYTHTRARAHAHQHIVNNNTGTDSDQTVSKTRRARTTENIFKNILCPLSLLVA